MNVAIWLTASYLVGLAVAFGLGTMKVNSIKRLEAAMEADPFPPIIITIIDGTVLLKVHPYRSWRTLWRMRFVACSVSMRFDGSDANLIHSPIKDTWSDAVWEARSLLLRMVWKERGMSPWEGFPHERGHGSPSSSER